MRTSSTSETHSRQQIQALDALISTGALARGRHQERAVARRSSRPEPAERMPANPAPADLRVSGNGVEWLDVPQWRELEWLWHGFSTRRPGPVSHSASGRKHELNLGFTPGEERETVARNRALFAEALTGGPATPLIAVKQFHSHHVVHARRGDAGLASPRRADGQITGEPGLLLAVLTADCIPVLVADRRRRVVGAFHAGWRGTVGRIVECGVGRMRLEFGSRPEDLVAAIGPGIGACCYAVGEEVQAEFESQFAYAEKLFTEVYDPDSIRIKYPMLFLNQRAPGHSPPGVKLHLDLIEANRRQLIDAGLKPERIHQAGGCTSCHTDRFFSYRAEHGHTGRMMSAIGIRGSKRD